MSDKDKKRLLIAGVIALVLLLLFLAWRRWQAVRNFGLPDFTMGGFEIVVNPPGGINVTWVTQPPAEYVINGSACDCGCNSLTIEAPNFDFMIDGLNAYIRENAIQSAQQLYAFYGIDWSRWSGVE